MNKYQSYKPSGVEWVGEIPEHWKFIKTNIIGAQNIIETSIEKKVCNGLTLILLKPS